MGALIILFGTQKWGRHISVNLQLLSVCLLYYAHGPEFNTYRSLLTRAKTRFVTPEIYSCVSE